VEAITGHSTPVLVPCGCFGFQPSPIRQKGVQQPPTFRLMSIVAKRLPISATAEHLYQFDKVTSITKNSSEVTAKTASITDE